MKTVFLTDIDDTLMLTARKIRDVGLERCTVASTLADGSASGYRTPRLMALRDLMAVGTVVPVTARSREVMARCDVPQAPAICSNGGVIVGADGAVDREWHDRIAASIGDGEQLRAVHEKAAERGGKDFRHWIVEEDGLPLYLVMKHNASDENAVQHLSEELDDEVVPEGWRLHVNGNNMAISPPWISKRAAVRHYLARLRDAHPDVLAIGVGDSISDLGFMAECDFSMNPTGSQIGRLLAKGHSW